MKEEFDLAWQNTANGVYKTRIGDDFKTLLDYTESVPKLDAINNYYPDSQFRFADNKITAHKINSKLVLSIPLDSNEKIYGFGLSYKTLNQLGKVLNLKTDHYSGADNGRAHAPCPVYFSSSGYGVFFNTPEPLTVYVGTTARKGPKTEAMAKDRNTDKSWKSLPISDCIEVVLKDVETVTGHFNAVREFVEAVREAI